MATFSYNLHQIAEHAASRASADYDAKLSMWRATAAALVDRVKEECIKAAEKGLDGVNVKLADDMSIYDEVQSRCSDSCIQRVTQASFIEEEVRRALNTMGFVQAVVFRGPQEAYWLPSRSLFAYLKWSVGLFNKEKACSKHTGNLEAPCGICSETGPVMCLVPCGHLLCRPCALRQESCCPFCRSCISHRQALFLP
mmetsp:Transcript_42004/g.90223  ORF Transcript_42004/g.90223 Transcript_42004/m.90223 type:complete len:197 (-) Transcript_42004:26-616(-)